MTDRIRQHGASAPRTFFVCAAITICAASRPAAAEAPDAAQPLPATIPANTFAYTSARLADVPPEFRLRARTSARSGTAAETERAPYPNAASASPRVRAAHLEAANARFVDRSAIINRLKEMDSLQLIRFWETKDLCLYFGVDERGFAGLNLTRRKAPGAGRSDDDAERDSERRVAVDHYRKLTGERSPTFPPAPSLHASLASD